MLCNGGITMTNEYTNKVNFVNELGRLLNIYTNHRTGVVELIYNNNNGYETVEIVFDNGNTRTINVTYDSELAIMNDVYHALI